MTIDHTVIESLMAWARQQAPLDKTKSFIPDNIMEPWPRRRRVRIEISVEPYIGRIGWFGRQAGNDPPTHERVQCRVYLAEPRCNLSGSPHINCECKPIAETRIG